ncbi:phosphotransferase family protein [Georgenia ruanii]|uniref:Phosphotransferase n=1 Tax=Georgenia ruanii TaxID=348442 RepID=A0A7J9V0T0_9MICO|nr:phosphotransferase family protein [Georgenia ruanii]MPV90476.1 phosphotransferase [Georgenia ruanii]
MVHLPGIDEASITAWFARAVPAAQAPLTFELIAGGHSNLTYRVTDVTGQAWIIRRPPTGELLATAHDMAREWKLIEALNGHVPVPPPVAMCTDADVTGAPFHVTEFVDGVVLRDAKVADDVPLELRPLVSESFVRAIGALHTLEPAAVGLQDLGKGVGYVGRQLKRWRQQYELSRTRDVPGVEWTYERLVACMPEREQVSVVHADYRLDNVILAPGGDVRAILDWELATLGDPLADVGSMIAYWTGEGEPSGMDYDWPTSAGGFLSRDEMAELYTGVTGIWVDDLDYYVAFAHWRIACIGEGVVARYRSGSMKEVTPGEVQVYADSTVYHAARATQIAAHLK